MDADIRLDGGSVVLVGDRVVAQTTEGLTAGSSITNGLHGSSSSGNDSGVWGENSGAGNGVTGDSAAGTGVVGHGTTNGVSGHSTSASDSGVWGENTGGGYGVSGSTTTDSPTRPAGVWGHNFGAGYGVWASSESGTAAGAQSKGQTYAVRAQNAGNPGTPSTGDAGAIPMPGVAQEGIGGGLSAHSDGGYDVYAASRTGIGVLARSSFGVGLRVEGRLEVQPSSIESAGPLGVATLPAGSTQVQVNSAVATSGSAILITPLNNPGAFLWVSDQTAGSFTINASAGVPSDTRIQYLIIN